MQVLDELRAVFSPEAETATAPAKTPVVSTVFDDDIADDDDGQPVASPVFSLTSILLDTSEALAAAQRLYDSTQSGLRFFSDFRRVVPTSQLRAEMAHELSDEDDYESSDSH